ncbi:porin family protein [Hymenobacter sp. BT559]|uniref:porin family protein n=1 Tax=Hymenobacter sp. BT559 TaxID=2795729 RepID=UPI0018ED2C82|nr:porin family protein [Hymenobacter sp. BT559]MBJ6142185.1 PorT family protein [Hymenobacter sp. BT559]
MLKALSLLAGSLLLSGSVYAQAGLRVGGTWMDIAKSLFEVRKGAASMDTNSQFGYHLGIYYQVPLTKRLSIVPELQFSRERQHATVENNNDPSYGSISEYELRLSYLYLPVLARATFGPVYLEAGPQFSWLVGGHGEGTIQTYSVDRTFTSTIDQAATERYNRLDAGLCLGVGATLPAGFGLSLRAYQGLRQVNREYMYNITFIPSSTSDEYHQFFQASLTYQLPSQL